MKVAFLLLCIVCAALLSAMVFVIQTGKVPLRPTPLPVETVQPETKALEQASTSFAEGDRKSLDELIKALNTERATLDTQRAELASREESVKLKEVALDSLKIEIESLQKELQTRISEVKASQQTNFRHLADMYSKMEPASASILLKEMDRNHAAVILNMITERSAAAIMDAAVQAGGTNAAIVAEWTDIIRNLKMEKAATKAKE